MFRSLVFAQNPLEVLFSRRKALDPVLALDFAS
jgi:hypothetical protein